MIFQSESVAKVLELHRLLVFASFPNFCHFSSITIKDTSISCKVMRQQKGSILKVPPFYEFDSFETEGAFSLMPFSKGLFKRPLVVGGESNGGLYFEGQERHYAKACQL